MKSALGNFIQRLMDEILELRITAAMYAGINASSPVKARNHFTRMARLCARRSRGQVERMERARGLV